MILCIDDDPRRISAFRKAFGGIWPARDLRAAVHCLNEMEGITRIYLDYDGVDGMAIAQHMASHGLHTDAKVFIHSSNYAGAVKMRDALAETHRVEMVNFAEVVGEARS